MKILITGGSGFIGRNLVEYLTPKYEVIAPTHQELELLDEDAVKDFFKKYDIDVVIHSAVKPGHRNAQDPTRLVYSNARMFFNLVRNGDFFKKMVLLSSGAVYDQRYYLPKMKEEYFDTHVPVDETGFSKYICAKCIEHLNHVIELRPFGVFGKYEDWEIRFISNAICKALFDLPITIKQNRRFDYVSIEDLLRVIEYFIEHPSRHRAFNVTPDAGLELKTIAQKVVFVSGKDLEIQIGQPEMGTEYSGDNKRLRNELAEFQFEEMDEAIRKLYDWYAFHRQWIRPSALLTDK